MLLIHPPGARICEPYSGIARIAGALGAGGETVQIWDASLESLLWLLEQKETEDHDTHLLRSVKNRKRALEELTSPKGYRSFDRYKQLLGYLDRLLPSFSRGDRWDITLSNYEDKKWNPLNPGDVCAASNRPEENPFFPYWQERLPGLVKEFIQGNTSGGAASNKPLRVGISLSFLSQALSGFALAGYFHQEYPGVKIIIGGGLITSWMRRFGSLDFLKPFPLEFIAGGGEAAVSPSGAKTVKGGASSHSFTGLTSLPYLSPGLVLPYGASLGCPYRKCTFCPERSESNPYEPLGARRTLGELRTLSEKHEPRMFHITDSEISPSLMKELASSGGVGVPWYGFSRFTHLLVDERFCLNLANSGCKMLCLGLESGDPGVLDAMNKGVNLQVVPRILENLKAAGIGTFVYLLFGTPQEDESAAFRTRDFAAAHGSLIDFINPSIFNMPVDYTFEREERGESEQRISSGDFGLRKAPLSLYRDFDHPTGWDRYKIRRFLKTEFKGTPEIREILGRTPPYFTANHAPFFLD